MVTGLGGSEGEFAGGGASLSDYGMVVVENFLDCDFNLEVGILDVVVELTIVFLGLEFACGSGSVVARENGFGYNVEVRVNVVDAYPRP